MTSDEWCCLRHQILASPESQAAVEKAFNEQVIYGTDAGKPRGFQPTAEQPRWLTDFLAAARFAQIGDTPAP